MEKSLKGYFTEKDLYRIVADKHGIPEKSVEYMYRFIVKYMRAIAREPNVLAISIPHLGTIYAKKPPIAAKLKKASPLFMQGVVYKRLKAKVDLIDEVCPTDRMSKHRASELINSRNFTPTQGLKQYEIALNEMQNKELKKQTFK